MKKVRLRVRIAAWWRLGWVRVLAAIVAAPAVALVVATGYYYVGVAHLIDARLHGERDRVLPRVFARPFELRRGQSLTERQLVDRLNDLGYAERMRAEKPGEFTLGGGVVAIVPRSPDLKGQVVQVIFQRPAPGAKAPAKGKPPPRPPDRVEQLEIGHDASERVVLDTPVLTSLVRGEREKRRPVALSVVPPRLIQAVLAIEDRRFYSHPGVDPIGIVSAMFSYARGRRDRGGASTITQQLVRNVFLPTFEGMSLQAARERSLKRKLLEQFLAIVLTRRASKDDILEMYLNDVPLGQRGSFAIFGVAEGARLFFGKDVSNLSVAEAATLAGVIQSPSALSPFNNPARCRDRRNVVIQAMVDEGYITAAVAQHATKEPLAIVERALEAEAPHFVDFVGQTLAEDYPGLTTTTNQAVDVMTTLDLHLQRLAQDAVRNGLTHVDELLARRKRRGRAEAALIAVDPQTGEVLAFVGGRSYNRSQYNRVIASRRQPGSVFKPFVYLTAFEQAARAGRTDVTPASITLDDPDTFEFGDQLWTPENFEKIYDGPITYRHALAHSRNLGTIHVAQTFGYGHVADLWKTLGVGSVPKPYPSIALGVFEATPYEIATAYTVFPNQGRIRPLKHIQMITSGGKNVTKRAAAQPRRVARPETTYLVTDMMRDVINQGTAAGVGGVRAAGFTLDAAGKTGTTNDLRDAWFVGFTPELLTVAWVGFDDNQPVGLTGAQAALPIWTQFMMRALAGHPNQSFDIPDGITFADIDVDTGKLATPKCPNTHHDPFIAGTQPTQLCELHNRPAPARLELPVEAVDR
jgi:penicillin-binding protein 1B